MSSLTKTLTYSTWYNVVHDIVFPQDRFKAIRMHPSNSCTKYHQIDTLRHRLTQCAEEAEIWITRHEVAEFL